MTIIESENVREGKPHIKGTQITVDDVYKFLNKQNLSTKQITERWEITEEELEEAIDYIDNHTEKVKQMIRDEQASMEEMEKTWREEMEKMAQEEQMRDRNQLSLITGYSPESFRLPCMLISTVYDPTAEKDRKGNSTAVLFGEALNYHHLLAKVFTTNRQEEVTKAENEMLPISEFIEVKAHDSWREAWLFHRDMVTNLGQDKYMNMYEEYCPDFLKERNNIESDRPKVKKFKDMDSAEAEEKFNSLAENRDRSVVEQAKEIVSAYNQLKD